MFSSIYSTICLMIVPNSVQQTYYSQKAGPMSVKKCAGSKWKATIASWGLTPKLGKKNPSYELKTASCSRTWTVSQSCESLWAKQQGLCTETSKGHTQDANNRRRERDTADDQDMRGEFSTVPFSLQLGTNESEALRNIEKRIFVLDRHNNHFEIFTEGTHLRERRFKAEIRRQASAAASLFLLLSKIAKMVSLFIELEFRIPSLASSMHQCWNRADFILGCILTNYRS